MLRWKMLAVLLVGLASTTLLHADKLRVVASFSLPADWVRQIAGDEVELTVLAGNGQDIHAFEAAPRDLATLAEADLVVEIGAGLEYWLDDMLAATRFQGRRLSLSEHLSLHEAEEDEHGHSHDGHGVGEHHDHGEHDPHVWMDPDNVRQMGEVLTEALCQLDPAHAEDYRRNEKRWAQRLQELDQYAIKRFSTLPSDERVIITYHDNLGYFAERYDIRIPATILGSVSTVSGEPSARQMARLIRLVKQDQVRAVFTDPGSNPRLAEQLCRETGLPTPQPLYVGSLAREVNGPQDYESLFLYTVDTIADSLQSSRHIE